MSLPRLPVSIMLSYELGRHSLKPLSVSSFSYLWTPGGGEDLFPGRVGKARPRTQSSWSRVFTDQQEGCLHPHCPSLASVSSVCFSEKNMRVGETAPCPRMGAAQRLPGCRTQACSVAFLPSLCSVPRDSCWLEFRRYNTLQKAETSH